MHIVVLGAGAWGTALTLHLAKRHNVLLWARKHSHCEEIRLKRENSRYLPHFKLPPNVLIDNKLESITDFINHNNALFVLASPMAAFTDNLQALQPYFPENACLIWLSKGVLLQQIDKDITDNSGLSLKSKNNYLSLLNKTIDSKLISAASQIKFAHQLIRQHLPKCCHYGALMGPSFAVEVARGLPTALTIASSSPICLDLIVNTFHYDQLRIYKSSDLIGVEVGAAIKNIIAIAVGISDGLNLGMNARAALITRGLHEIIQLGKALGAKAETFQGLTGLGDLVLTTTGDLSRNRQVGLLLAKGKMISEIVFTLGHVAEGVACAHAVKVLAEQQNIDMPITNAVCRIMFEQIKPEVVIAELLSRQIKSE